MLTCMISQGPPPPPLPEPTPVTAEEVDSLAAQLPSASCPSAEHSSNSELSSNFSSLALSTSPHRSLNPFVQPTDNSADQQLLDSIRRAFSSLPSLEASFRRAPAPPSSSPAPTTLQHRLPTIETLATFYGLIKSRPKAMELLRGEVERLLERPGETIWDGNGGWVVSLLEVSSSAFGEANSRSSSGFAGTWGGSEHDGADLPRYQQCPIWWSDYTPDQERRHRLVARFIGL